ncbi:MAG: hypothetical protein WBL66_01795, partial [Candidatus Acidiferrales bacterium]
MTVKESSLAGLVAFLGGLEFVCDGQYSATDSLRAVCAEELRARFHGKDGKVWLRTPADAGCVKHLGSGGPYFEPTATLVKGFVRKIQIFLPKIQIFLPKE